jgi:hypothetical protein
MQRVSFLVLAVSCGAGLLAAPVEHAPALDPTPEGILFFEQKIRPLLVANCHECHSSAHKKRGGLLLDSRVGLMRGGDTGAVVVPGKPGESRIIRAVRYTDPDLKMPQRGKLADQQIADLEAWVKMGAPWPDDKAPATVVAKAFDLRERAKHWSLQPIQEPKVPAVRDRPWCVSPIDAFLLARLEAAGLRPSAPADKRTLIRRVTFDLTGLPPTPQEIASFLADDAPDAFATLVDRLLESPQYGERWARHWLDLARYAETLGHEYDFELPDAFRYRDYVIRAFNADVPYDQFVMEQIAGDLLPNPRRNPADNSNESICGTGFWFLGEAKQAPVDIRADQADRIDNQIDVFSKTFLGMTIACARCHDHKFDAVSTRDYYALFGCLQSGRRQRAFVDDPAPIRQKIAALRTLQGEIKKVLDIEPPPALKDDQAIAGEPKVFADFRKDAWHHWSVSGEAFDANCGGGVLLQPDPKRPVKLVVAPGIAHSGLVSAKLAGVMRSPTFVLDKKKIHYHVLGQKGRINLVIDGFQLIGDPIYGGLTFTVDHEGLQWRTMDVAMWQGHQAYVEVLDDGPGYIGIEQIVFSDGAAPKGSQPAGDPGPVAKESDFPRLAELIKAYQSVDASLPAPTRALAIEDGTPVEARVYVRGNHKTPGEIAPRRFLEVFDLMLPTRADQPSFSRAARLALARRVVDPANPLTARVIVNRLWKHHFGEGLVRTPDDFGVLGQAPTHPELLDWLAVQLMRDGWSLKKMHRRMLLTRAYQMASSADRATDQADPDNKLLHRMPIRRLEGEAIRDAMLAVSGRLDRKMYGPGVLPYLTPFMGGRGRPGASGPLDGDGRRSIYLNVRRNFLSPMLVAFDYPTPFSTIGRRTVSNVPAQALTLLNNPAVLEQAAVWAKRMVAEQGLSAEGRIQKMYEQALGRLPSATEREETLAFVKERSEHYGAEGDFRIWADLGHVLFNVKEFIFVR